MSNSVIVSVLNNLYDQAVAVTEVAAAITAGTLRVSDGPAINDFSEQTLMTLGGLPVHEDLAEAASDWNWATLGGSGALADVDEIWHIPCGIHTVIGDGVFRTTRAIALNLFVPVAQFIRGTTLSIPQVMWCTPSLATVRQSATADGAEVLITFSADIYTRI
jgi:hypothetical protein